MKRVAPLVLAFALLGGTPSRGGELSPVQIKDARKLYLGKCAKCHKLYDPEKYSDEKWNEWMAKMTKKSKLKPEDAALLVQYIEAGRKGKVALPRK
ncbi:MAG: hypothetical protein RLY20_1318 [Verrucomicrobiota bacterium]